MSAKAFKREPAISVIMPSFLGNYPNAASNRVEKFHRAVNSVFIDPSVAVELIVVSDGCDITTHEASINPNKWGIRLIHLQKQPLFSGAVRNAGIDNAHAPIICYLDTDDIFLRGHLQAIWQGFYTGMNVDWVYYDDSVAGPYPVNGFPEPLYTRGVNPDTFGNIGTSSIAHRTNLSCRWTDGYGHDWEFVQQLKAYGANKKIDRAGYLVCHLPGGVDV